MRGRYAPLVTTPSTGPTSEPTSARPPAPATAPIELVAVDRSSRSVLENLGQLYRHDLSEGLGHLPNDDGTFNNRRLDVFRSGADPTMRAWLIRVGGRLGGFVMTSTDGQGRHHIGDFFIVRALRRSGVGREVIGRVLAAQPGPWWIGFQDYNAGAREFWIAVATQTVGDAWWIEHHPVPGLPHLPPDSFIGFTVTG